MGRMEPYVKEWYDFLDKGKIMGLRCRKCGSYEFPPVSVCNKCSGRDLNWVEMSGEGTLLTFGVTLYTGSSFADVGPYIVGSVALKEGPTFAAMIQGVDPDNAVDLYERSPVTVQAEVQDRGHFKFVSFRVKS